MSIIYDALKKAQIRLSNAGDIQKKSNPWLLIGTLFVFIGFLGCGFVLMLLISSSSKKTIVQEVPAQIQGEEKKSALNLSLVSKPKNTSQVELNGIISMEGEYMALINNQILKEGDYIQDMRIISITSDKVELYSKGKITVLTQK